MAAVVTTNAARVTLVWALSGTEYAVNVLHYDVGGLGTITQAHADDLAAEVSAAFSAAGSWQDIAGTVVTLARTTIRDLRTLNRPEFSSVVGVAGSAASNLLPLASSLVVTLRTALAGRSYRGRVYLPGATEANNSATGNADTLAIDAADDFITRLDAVTLQGTEVVLAIRSAVADGVARNPAILTPVTSHAVRDNIWDVQRRRAYAGI